MLCGDDDLPRSGTQHRAPRGRARRSPVVALAAGPRSVAPDHAHARGTRRGRCATRRDVRPRRSCVDALAGADARVRGSPMRGPGVCLGHASYVALDRRCRDGLQAGRTAATPSSTARDAAGRDHRHRRQGDGRAGRDAGKRSTPASRPSTTARRPRSWSMPPRSMQPRLPRCRPPMRTHGATTTPRRGRSRTLASGSSR